jgi:hypothetical protein
LNTGAPATPANPARNVPITHAVADVAERFTPRSWASVGRSTTARIRRPSIVWRSNSHRPIAQATAAMNTIS